MFSDKVGGHQRQVDRRVYKVVAVVVRSKKVCITNWGRPETTV